MDSTEERNDGITNLEENSEILNSPLEVFKRPSVTEKISKKEKN